MLSLILGTMKSGKSTKLLNLENSVNEDFALIAPSVSKREFFARNIENNLVVFDEKFDYSSFKIILIDEIQFFSKDYIREIIKKRNSHDFILAGLISNTQNKMWENVVKLFPYADKVELCYANCDKCGCKNAKYHIGNGFIGDDYLVVCERCNEKFLLNKSSMNSMEV